MSQVDFSPSGAASGARSSRSDIPDLATHLSLLRRVTTGALPASAVASAMAASPELRNATAALAVLGLHPVEPLPPPLPASPPPPILARITANTSAARATLKWGPRAEAVVVARASEIWAVDRQAIVGSASWIKEGEEDAAGQVSGGDSERVRVEPEDPSGGCVGSPCSSSPPSRFSWTLADVGSVAERTGVSKDALDEVEAMVEAVGKLHNASYDLPLSPVTMSQGGGSLKSMCEVSSSLPLPVLDSIPSVAGDPPALDPKLSAYVYATTPMTTDCSFGAAPARRMTLPAVELARALQTWSDALLQRPDATWAPRLAALIGICTGRDAPADVSTIAWISWVRSVRALSASAAATPGSGEGPFASGGISRTFAMLLLAPFGSSAGASVPGEQAAGALAALARYRTVFTDFAALRIGQDPGVDALKSPPAALEFVAASVMLPGPVCGVVLDFLASIVSQNVPGVVAAE